MQFFSRKRFHLCLTGLDKVITPPPPFVGASKPFHWMRLDLPSRRASTGILVNEVDEQTALRCVQRSRYSIHNPSYPYTTLFASHQPQRTFTPPTTNYPPQ